MEFTDIDPSQFLDQLNWDNEDESPRQRDESQYSCDVNTRRGQDAADNGAYPWDILLGPIDGARENEVESRRAPTVDPKDPGDSAQQRQQHQGTGMQSFPPMASYESLMSSQNQNHQQDQPHLLSHPLAMTSMSSCPSFPLSKPSNGAGNTASNANAAVCTDVNKPGSASISNSETENLRRISTMPQSSCISGTTSNATWSQLGSSQTSGSNNDISAASNNNNNDSSSSPNPLLPSWNDSMGDLMYSPLLNMGISSNTDTTNSTTNPFQCNPMNSPFGSTPHHTSMLNHHYGMAINGFHPQVNAIVNPVVLPLNGSIPTHGIPARAGTTSPGTVKTSNAGKSTGGSSTSKASKQKDKKASNERNEREQMRAKKITQLIHEIRSNMEAEGWKEEMKSKYETLSQCKEYVEYLKRCHKEKETDIEHTKKLIEEKALLEGRSDPESIHDSVASSLTASTRNSTAEDPNGGSDKESSSSSDNDQDQLDRRSRKNRKKSISYAEGIATAAERPNKKLRASPKQPSSSESSSEEDVGAVRQGPGGKNISFDKTNSSLSDMTDSNRSSMNGAIKNKKRQVQQQTAVSKGKLPTTASSVSSTAAVVRGNAQKSSQSHSRHRSSMLEAIAEGYDNQRRPHKKKRRSFDHNYKEVFQKSNVPQLIVTLSGRVVVWNEFFLLITGLTKREAKNLSIFSIVDSSQLTDLYKFIARALADHKPPVPSSTVAKPPSKPSDESWQAVTLKCVRFASKQNKQETTHPNPLNITVALMADEDRDKNCFHCIITDSDSPGTGTYGFGSVTPELLSVLYTADGENNTKETPTEHEHLVGHRVNK